MDRDNSNDRTTAGVIAATAIIASIALLALAGLGGVSCAAEGENAGGSEGEMTGAAVSAASVTDSINYQGRLTDSSVSPLTGTYTMTFGLYNVSTGGTALATDMHDVDVTDGLFNTHIDFGFGTNYFDGRELWLGVAVGTDSEMTPRQELRPVPYALSLRPGAEIIGSVRGHVLKVKNTADWSCGVCADATGDGGYGVFAVSDKGYGVYGKGGKYGGYFTTNQGGTSCNDRNAGVNATTTYDYSDGVRASTTGKLSDGVHAFTTGDSSDGVYASTTGDSSDGVRASTTGKLSDGVHAFTTGYNSRGVYADADGDYSVGVYASSHQYHGIFADTGRLDHKYGVMTRDKMCAHHGYDTACADVAEYFPTPEDPETRNRDGDRPSRWQQTQVLHERV